MYLNFVGIIKEMKPVVDFFRDGEQRTKQTIVIERHDGRLLVVDCWNPSIFSALRAGNLITGTVAVESEQNKNNPDLYFHKLLLIKSEKLWYLQHASHTISEEEWDSRLSSTLSQIASRNMTDVGMLAQERFSPETLDYLSKESR